MIRVSTSVATSILVMITRSPSVGRAKQLTYLRENSWVLDGLTEIRRTDRNLLTIHVIFRIA
jgi:hypothetical protein